MTETVKLAASDGVEDHHFGWSVSLSGDVAAVGAFGDSDFGFRSGAAYVFGGLAGIDCNENGESDRCDIHDGVSDDLNGDGIPDECEPPCPWDLDGDSNVFVTDLLLLGDFGTCDGSPADFDGDGCVGVPDLLALIANFGPCPGSECVWDVNGDGFVDNDDLQRDHIGVWAREPPVVATNSIRGRKGQGPPSSGRDRCPAGAAPIGFSEPPHSGLHRPNERPSRRHLVGFRRSARSFSGSGSASDDVASWSFEIEGCV